MDTETFKITQMKIKEVRKENKKLDAFYSDFHPVGDQLFPYHIMYDLQADKPIVVELYYSKITIDEPQSFPYKVSSKYTRIQ
ncbi:MAG: DUF4292 domain-containing protein [Bacteroidales bacterium]